MRERLRTGGEDAAKAIDNVAVIVQARLRSQRAPRKMIRPFAGTTLLDITLEKVRASSVILLSNFYLAVHEPELVAIGRQHGVQIFHRSERSALGEDLLEVYEWHDRLPHEHVVVINACAPLLRVETIDAFIQTYVSQPIDGLFGVVPERDYFFDAAGRLITAWPPGTKMLNTKRVGVTYRAAHCLYAGRRSTIAEGYWMGTFQRADDPVLFPLDPLEAMDIDHQWQFDVAEAYYREHVLGSRVVR